MPLDTASFDLHRTLPLDAATLWEVMTDARHRESWGAPGEGMVLTVETADVREGGQDRHRCGPAEAPDFVVLTRWYNLAAPERAVFTETLVVGDDSFFTSLITYVLTPAGRATELAITVAVSSFDGAGAIDEVRAGWEGGLANLDAYIAELAKGAS